MLLLKPGSPSYVILHFIAMHITALLVDIHPTCKDIFQLFPARHRNRGQANLVAIEFAYIQALISSEMHFV